MTGPEPIAYTVEHIRAVIERPPVAELGVEITIDASGRIRLAGPVSSDMQRTAIVAAVRAASPGGEVVDDLSVSHRPPDDEIEELS